MKLKNCISRWLPLMVMVTSSALADPVWHCSRNTQEAALAQKEASAQENRFFIASFNSAADVIEVSVRDLIDVYTGVPVRVGGMPLSACFLAGNDSLTSSALASLGLSLAPIQAMARKSNIVQNNLHIATDEPQMLNCVAKNFPAVGYASQPHESKDVLPCF
jgi:hypothetical protein